MAAQGGSLAAPRPLAPCRLWSSIQSGFVQAVDGGRLGQVIIELGGGRRTMSDSIDYSVGLEMLVRIGEPVEMGQPLMHVFCHDGQIQQVLPHLMAAFVIGEEPVESPELIVDRV